MRYRYDGPIPVKCAGRLWLPGEEAHTTHEINHPHFTKVTPVKAKPKQEAPPDADN